MSSDIRAFAVWEVGKGVEAFSYTPGELGEEEVEIRVEVCGLCHSDLSMLDNEWGRSTYPLEPYVYEI